MREVGPLSGCVPERLKWKLGSVSPLSTLLYLSGSVSRMSLAVFLHPIWANGIKGKNQSPKIYFFCFISSDVTTLHCCRNFHFGWVLEVWERRLIQEEYLHFDHTNSSRSKGDKIRQKGSWIIQIYHHLTWHFKIQSSNVPDTQFLLKGQVTHFTLFYTGSYLLEMALWGVDHLLFLC